eukprot:GHVL01032949.1.p1 GENE.GHVL01032949.1~~GHVL01032949.1.p1  ORF type:complete len:561 (+),score=70.53 GHVL01032949.1:58-1683(+)
MADFMLTVPVLKERIIDKSHLLVPLSVYNNLIELYPDDEPLMLFWCSRSRYTEDDDNYYIRYPFNRNDKLEDVPSYVVTKRSFNLFLLCKMFTLERDNSMYVKSKLARLLIPFISNPPPSIESIEKDGQMKILTDFVEIAQDIEFDDGDEVLVVGSSSEGGVCAGRSYNVLSYMTDKRVKVHLYDEYDVDCVYDIGSVTYQHYAMNYKYDINVKKFKLLIDDAWIDKKEYRPWDKFSYFRLVKNFSIKWFTHYAMPSGRFMKKKQRYRTKKHEMRLSTSVPMISFKRCDQLGTCPKCTWFKYLLKREYSVEFYDFILSMHDKHCVTKELRSVQGIVGTSTMKWHKVTPSDLLFEGFVTVAYDAVKGLPLFYPNVERSRGRKIAFTQKENVRPDLYEMCIVVVCQLNGVYLINKEQIDGFEYESQYDYDIQYDMVEILNQSYEHKNAKAFLSKFESNDMQLHYNFPEEEVIYHDRIVERIAKSRYKFRNDYIKEHAGYTPEKGFWGTRDCKQYNKRCDEGVCLRKGRYAFINSIRRQELEYG